MKYLKLSIKLLKARFRMLSIRLAIRRRRFWHIRHNLLEHQQLQYLDQIDMIEAEIHDIRIELGLLSL